MNNNDNKQIIENEQNTKEEKYMVTVNQEMERETIEGEIMVTDREVASITENTLMKDKENKMLFGVCSGIAKHLGWSAKRVRTLLILLTLLGGSGILAYTLLALFMPKKTQVEMGGTSNEADVTPEEAVAL